MTTHTEPGTIILEDGRFQFTFHPEPFWAGIRTALVSFVDGDKGSMGKALFDGLGSFSKTNTIEHKAYRLIYTALRKACVAVLTDTPDQERLLEKVGHAGLRSAVFHLEMSRKLGTGRYVIDAGFFAEPHRDVLLQDAKEDFHSFLQTVLGLEEKHANALAVVLPGKFVRELAREWEQADYSGLVEHFKNPFLDPLKKLAVREARHADLLQRFAKPAFNDPRVTLAEMYIEPEFWVHGRCVDEKNDRFEKVEKSPGERFHFFRHKKHRDLHTYFLEWLQGRSPLGLKGEEERLLVLLGHPGQGKTSFSLRTIKQLLQENQGLVNSVFLVRLRSITTVENLLTEPLKTLREQPGLRQPDTDRLPEGELQNSLLLLDGLDELYMNKGLTLDQIQEFVRRLRQDLENFPVPGLRIVLTSRTNYLRLDAHRDDDYLVLHLAEFSLEQQQDWLRRYMVYYPDIKLSAEKLAVINKEGNHAYKKIRELVRQPILLQMIAVADLDIDEKANSAKIYDLLFAKLIERDWSEDKQLPKYHNLDVRDLRRFLRTLAMHIFQKPIGQEYARRADFEDPDSKLYRVVADLAAKMEMEQLPMKDFTRNLLVSAYFQEVERNPEEKKRGVDYDDYAYEFLHKSLQEYLVAENIWEECRRFFLKKDDDDRWEVQTAEQVMDKIHPLFSPKVLTDEIAEYLREMVRNHESTDKAALKARLKHFFPELLRHSFLWEHKAQRNEPSAMEKMLGNFFGYLSLCSALVTPHAVSPQDKAAFQSIIEAENFLPKNDLRTTAHFLVLLQRSYFRKLEFNHQNLGGADLSGADLRGADLRGAYLGGAYLGGADLIRADLRGADLRGAYLVGAYLRGAYLFGAYLRGADLIRADLGGADLSEIDLGGANLGGANLGGANLSGANLQNAVLFEETSGFANFENAQMEEVTGLETAIGLEHANFKGTIYEGKFSKEK